MAIPTISTYPSTPPQPGPRSAPTASPSPPPRALQSPALPAVPNVEAARQHKLLGNHYYQLRHYPLAVNEYQKALQADPNYTDAYYNMAKAYLNMGDETRAVDALQRLLLQDPLDHEARVVVAERLSDLGRYEEARKHYRFILSHEPQYDTAFRKLRYLEATFPTTIPPVSPQQIASGIQATVDQAKELVRQHYLSQNRPQMIQLLDVIPFAFAPTQEVQNTANVAEYDFRAGPRGVIRLQRELAFAHPGVLGAYLAHEMEHARDGDNLSSLQEEQNGYHQLALFWGRFKGNTIEPNLDLAFQLLQQGPQYLNAKVSELYASRDPSLPQKSPGHGLPVSWANPNLVQGYELEKMNNYVQYVLERIQNAIPAYHPFLSQTPSTAPPAPGVISIPGIPTPPMPRPNYLPEVPVMTVMPQAAPSVSIQSRSQMLNGPR